MNPSPPALPVEAPVAPAVAKRRSIWRGLFDVARMFLIGFPLYGALALGVYGVLLVATLPLPRGARKRISRQGIYLGISFWMRVMEQIGVLKVEFQALETLQAARGVVVAPNHPTLLDATQFLARVPQLTCLMKKSILSNPFMGGLTRLAEYLQNDHGPEFIRRGRDALLAGDNLLIFPEGTRTVEPPVNAFKKGFALIAMLAEAPVQTVFIDVSEFFLGKRWPLWRLPHLPVCYTVRIGRVFRPHPGQTAKAFGEEIEAYFRAELESAGPGVRRKGQGIS